MNGTFSLGGEGLDNDSEFTSERHLQSKFVNKVITKVQ